MDIDIPPRWTLVEPGSLAAPEIASSGGIRIALEPGAGFGDGRHPTTVLCMQAIAALAPREQRVWRMLDFGSGSGILAIAAAKLGAQVRAIEIDQRALEHAHANASTIRLYGTNSHTSRRLVGAPTAINSLTIWDV